MQKTLIILGVLLIVIGLGWPVFSKIPLGRLPGDIMVNKPNVKFFFPITTMIILSMVFTLLLRLFSK
ncbi:MAG: hypothetical protein ACI9TH_004928 [Kiritimatiellia bacterium]|jgi:hypothetical protein